MQGDRAGARGDRRAHSERVELVRIDIDANPRTADRYGVLSIPTVTLFEGGEARATVYGARPKKHFVKTFGAYL